MKASKLRLNLFDKRGRSKNPKNTELYCEIVGDLPSHIALHDALADALLTASSYYQGVQRGWWRW